MNIINQLLDLTEDTLDSISIESLLNAGLDPDDFDFESES
jgi:hypothetical protein